MRCKLGMCMAALLATTTAYSADEAVSTTEFDQITSTPFIVTNAKSGMAVEVHLKAGGTAAASQGYNDVGTWRREGNSGYCVRWNKQRLDDRCSNFIRRDGKLGLASPPSEDVTWWVTEAKK